MSAASKVGAVKTMKPVIIRQLFLQHISDNLVILDEENGSCRKHGFHLPQLCGPLAAQKANSIMAKVWGLS